MGDELIELFAQTCNVHKKESDGSDDDLDYTYHYSTLKRCSWKDNKLNRICAPLYELVSHMEESLIAVVKREDDTHALGIWDQDGRGGELIRIVKYCPFYGVETK